MKQSQANLGSSLVEQLSDDAQARLADLLDEYMTGLERGFPPDRAALVARFPELAEPLGQLLDGLEQFQGAAEAFRVHPRRLPAAGEDGPREIGDFQLVREIGRGGMGIVYEAKQLSLDRLVAIKILPFASMLDTRQIARFNNEAKAAAQLHHPHIVPVFAVGCDRGVHYYAMQLIDGVSLDELISDKCRPTTATVPVPPRASESLRTEARSNPSASNGSISHSLASASTESLRAFTTSFSSSDKHRIHRAAEICLQAARALQHAHEYGVVHRDIKPSNLLLDRDGKLWVADFGLARIRSDDGVTASGDVLGTARYMSPEQAAGQVLDERTDVYSLGVTLYELLTLRAAFPQSDRHKLLRSIVEDDPPRPRRIQSAIPSDLETIALKAMEKSRDNRYASAADMAADLQAFLEHKTIRARRPSLVDRTEKWLKRHRTLAVSATILMLLALVGSAASAFMIAGAQRETRKALADAERNLKLSEAQHERAERLFRQAREAVERLGAEPALELGAVPGSEAVQQKILREALRYYQDFARQAASDATLRVDLAEAHFQAANLAKLLGDPQQAVADYKDAQLILSELAEESPADPHVHALLGLAYNNLGLVYNDAEDLEHARDAFRRAIRIQENLLSEKSADLKSQGNLAGTLCNLAVLENRQEHSDEAIRLLHKAIDALRNLVARAPEDRRYRADLALALNNLGFVHRKSPTDEALTLCREAIAIQEAISKESPDDPGNQANLAQSWNNLGSLLSKQGSRADAIESFRRAIAVQEALVRKSGAVVRYRADLAVTYNNLGWCLSDDTKFAEAQRSFLAARDILDGLAASNANQANYRSQLGGVWNNIGIAHERAGQLAEAARAFDQAIANQKIACEMASHVSEYREFLVNHLQHQRRILRAANRGDDAAALEATWRTLLADGETATPTHNLQRP